MSNAKPIDAMTQISHCVVLRRGAADESMPPFYAIPPDYRQPPGAPSVPLPLPPRSPGFSVVPDPASVPTGPPP